MAGEQTKKAAAWVLFDRIVAEAAPQGVHTNPWTNGPNGQPLFRPDYVTLERLLGVPLHLRAGTQSGVPALALDVWLSYELRRAGFDSDQVWPRPTVPRILPGSISALVKSLPKTMRLPLEERVRSRSNITGATSASGTVLGKNYLKQVDVIISDWATGPELLISTKRMDSSYGKNAPNRVEESYGDAKNLRLRHPLAALGFVFGLRSNILQEEPKTAEWLFDLLIKLGQEDDAYHATCLLLMEYAGDSTSTGFDGEEPEGILEPGPETIEDQEVEEAFAPSEDAIAEALNSLPKVTILQDRAPEELSPGRFLATMVERVLKATPVNMHEVARSRRAEAIVPPPSH